MSVAVAVQKDGVVVLACDSQTSFGAERVPPENRVEVKYLKVGNAYVASTGWTLYTNILRDVLKRRRSVPRLDSEDSIFRFFNDLWRQLHERYSFVNDQADDSDGSPFGNLDSSFIVVSPQGLFSVSTDLSVARFDRYFAIGSGAPVALGALHALYDRRGAAETIAKAAVSAAISHDIYCGSPINAVSLRATARKGNARKR